MICKFVQHLGKFKKRCTCACKIADMKILLLY